MASESATSGHVQPLQVGLATTATDCRSALDALDHCADIELRALCGVPLEAQLPPGVERFESPRDLAARANISALIVVADPRSGVEAALAGIAARKHVYLHGTLGRTFGEGAALAKAADGGPTVLAVESWWERIREPFRRVTRTLEDFKPSLISIRVRGTPPEPRDWRYDPEAAAGGALAVLAPGWLDALLSMRRLPETVSAATGRFRRDSAATPRESEDHAVALLRWSAGLNATVEVAWGGAHPEGLMLLENGELRVELSDTSAALRRADGTAIEEIVLPRAGLTDQLELFSQAIFRDEARAAARGAIDRSLAVRACLDSIYLSARTSQPESPRNLYAANGWPEPRA